MEMKLYLLGLLTFVSFVCSAQDLLVNGDFEEENICTEYKVTCAPEAWISTTNGFSNYFKDRNRAYSGNHCMAVEGGHTNKPYRRTFVRSRLLCGLRRDASYKLSFYIKSPHDILDSIGIYFSANDFLFEKTNYRKIKPSIYLHNENIPFAKGDTNWQKVDLVYKANGNEGFITIGNFSLRDITGPTGISMVNQFYIFLDNISMVPSDVNERICNDWIATKEDIYSQDERHEYLERLIKLYRSRSPEPPAISKTTLVLIDTLILPDILFATGNASLQRNSYKFLDEIIAKNAGRQIDSLVIKGHTDNTGTTIGNERLSGDRAKSVADYLLARISQTATQCFIYGLADRMPAADNASPEGRQRNRRVEILVYIRE
jgi:outer membrane protein OmpA-like peptidoglycan-associated protein